MRTQRGIGCILGLLAALATAGGCDNGQTAGPKTTPTPPRTPAATQPAATQPAMTPPVTAPAASAGDATPAKALAAAGGATALVPTAAPAAASGGIAELPVTTPAPPSDPKKTPQTARVPGWYQWRGPEQTGVSREKNLPAEWDPETGKNVIWASDVGGMSTPVVWNGKLYTFTRTGEEPAGSADYPTLTPGPKTQEALTCVDINTGKVLWRNLENMTQTEVPFHRLGWSSPCVDPATGRVYAMGSQCTLVCLDGDTGKPVWERQMTEEFGMISTFGGRTPAPSIDEDQLLIGGVSFGWGDQARGQHRLFALNKNTGELNWSTATGGLPVDAPQNTPVTTVVNGQRLVIMAAGDGGIHAFQSRTGKKVWTFKASKRGINTSVVVDGDRLYCSHGLDNFDTRELGRVFCLDIAHIENGSPKELWHKAGVEAAFPTSCVTDKWLYVVDDRCRLYQFDKMTGKLAWRKPMGSVGKPSPVFADGKLYVADGNGKFTIIQPGETDADTKILSRVELFEKLGREYVIYGSPAIADGRIYLQAATKLYCIGLKDAKPETGDIPQLAEEKPVDPKVAQVQVVPNDVSLHAGQKLAFRARTFDANGRLIAEVPAGEAKWAIGQLTIPAAPAPAAAPMPKPEGVPASLTGGAAAATPAAGGANPGAPGVTAAQGVSAGAAAKAETPDAARAALAAQASTQPVAPPTKAGNLQGDVAADGTFASKPGPHQAGTVVATVGGATGEARVRVLPPLPWKFDFDSAPVDKPPLTWLGAGGKYAVVADPEDANNKVVQKLMNVDLYYRARTNFGTVDMSNYTVQADAKVHEKVTADRRYVPSAAVMNSRYVLVLDGMGQNLQIHIWPSALPDDRNPHGSLEKSMKFPSEAKKWYRLKLQVTQEGGKAVARGKAWPAGGDEPKAWMLTLEDTIPNDHGNPGLFSVSLVGQFKSEVYYDNILVTPNAPAGTAGASAGADVNK